MTLLQAMERVPWTTMVVAMVYRIAGAYTKPWDPCEVCDNEFSEKHFVTIRASDGFSCDLRVGKRCAMGPERHR